METWMIGREDSRSPSNKPSRAGARCAGSWQEADLWPQGEVWNLLFSSEQ